MLECKSRGAYLMGLTTYGKYEIEDQVNFTVYVPKVDEHFIGSLAVIPLQLLGYYVSVAKGLDVDKPRNLAKSVTVEWLDMEREIPVLYKRKEDCCGCTACYAICPKEAISMVEDEDPVC